MLKDNKKMYDDPIHDIVNKPNYLKRKIIYFLENFNG